MPPLAQTCKLKVAVTAKAKRCVGIAGPIGSGKTTLARGLCAVTEWTYVTEDRPALAYLNDQYQSPGRWAFETQLAFIGDKLIEIREFLDSDSCTVCVIDRTLDEDIEVFGQHFIECGHMSQRTARTYGIVAKLLRASVPRPNLTIYCKCCLSTCQKRIGARLPQYRYPAGFVEAIHARYESWLVAHRPSLVLDSEQLDWRNPRVLREILVEVQRCL